MSDEELRSMIEPYLEHIVVDEKIDTRLLLAMCREIERTARHRASETAFAMANAITDGVPDMSRRISQLILNRDQTD